MLLGPYVTPGIPHPTSNRQGPEGKEREGSSGAHKGQPEPLGCLPTPAPPAPVASCPASPPQNSRRAYRTRFLGNRLSGIFPPLSPHPPRATLPRARTHTHTHTPSLRTYPPFLAMSISHQCPSSLPVGRLLKKSGGGLRAVYIRCHRGSDFRNEQ